MKKKHISSFSAIYILGGLCLILFQFYSIGLEIYTVNTSNKIFEELQKDIETLEVKKEEKNKILQIRSTPEYIDRFKKENFDIYQEGEVVLILPPEEKKEDIFENLSPLEIELELKKRIPIDQQWKEVFFHS